MTLGKFIARLFRAGAATEDSVKRMADEVNKRPVLGGSQISAEGVLEPGDVSHRITGLTVDKTGAVYAQGEILDTPKGKILLEGLMKPTSRSVSMSCRLREPAGEEGQVKR